jgi:muconolactone delta-isomerase
MKIIAIEHEVSGARAEQFAPLAKDEARAAWELHQSGVIRELYFRADRSEAVLVLECPGTAEAEQALSALPLVQAGLITFELIPLRAYPGFGRLFER